MRIFGIDMCSEWPFRYQVATRSGKTKNCYLSSRAVAIRWLNSTDSFHFKLMVQSRYTSIFSKEADLVLTPLSNVCRCLLMFIYLVLNGFSLSPYSLLLYQVLEVCLLCWNHFFIFYPVKSVFLFNKAGLEVHINILASLN